jgi:hypothetical protein
MTGDWPDKYRLILQRGVSLFPATFAIEVQMLPKEFQEEAASTE